MAVAIVLILMGQIIYFSPNLGSTPARNIQISNIPDYKLLSNEANNFLSSTSIAFTENRGQLKNDDVRFYDQGGAVWFTDSGVWFEVREEIITRGQGSQFRGQGRVSGLDFDPMGRFREPEPMKYKRVILKQEFMGANPVQPVGRERLSWNSNFFYGNDSLKWCTEVPNYAGVYYENLYDGIDLKYYSNQNGPKYDFIVHPGADPEQIKMEYKGADELSLDNNGDLHIKTKINEMIDSQLFIFQEINNMFIPVEGRFVLNNDFEYGFEIYGDYLRDEKLIIDPMVIIKYSTFMGGSGRDWGESIAVDQFENAYVTGITQSTDFPTTPGANDTSYNGGQYGDVYIFKLNSNGSNLEYSTYIGGADTEHGLGIDVDSAGCVYATGYTSSSNFPTTLNAYDRTYNMVNFSLPDAFVSKLNTNGSKLIYSTYLGGTMLENAYGVTVDNQGNAYVTGFSGSSNFPITPMAYDTTANGNFDCFITKLNRSGSTLDYSTFVGGGDSDGGLDIILDENNNVFVAGYSYSSNFPTSIDANDSTQNGGCDVIVFKLDKLGSILLFSTYIGGNDWDFGFAITIDSIGNSYVTGRTRSNNFPCSINCLDDTFNGTEDLYYFKLNPNGGTLIYSTYIGGNDTEMGFGIALDYDGNIVITGYTYSIDFPITFDALKPLCEQMDGFLTKISPSGSQIIYSTFIGGLNNTMVKDIAIDYKDFHYLTGYTNSVDFNTTPGAYTNLFSGMDDIFVMKLLGTQIFNISSLTLMKNNTPTNITYSRLCPYTFRVKILDTYTISNLSDVYLTLDPQGSNLILNWDRSTSIFTEISDSNDYISISQTGNVFYSNYYWNIDFNITFNWHYPDEDFHEVKTNAISTNIASLWLNRTNLYRVENDLVLNGSLITKDEDENIIVQDDLVKGGETLNWTGRMPVYEGSNSTHPPMSEFDVLIWNEDGDSWIAPLGHNIPSPIPGAKYFTIELNVSKLSDYDGETYIFNLSKIPPECDKSNLSFTIRIDGDNISFSNPEPKYAAWQNVSMVDVGINITDIGGGVVLGSSVMHCYSIDDKKTWTDWKQIPGFNSSVSIEPVDTIRFNEGEGNFIKWKAQDSVGNGPDISDEYKIAIDTKPIIFSNATPSSKNVSYSKDVEVGITITDTTSGVNASTIEYRTSNDNGITWTTWIPVARLSNGSVVNVTLVLTLLNGTGNRIKWRASDIAGNGPTESKTYTLNVDIPRVRLWQPQNNLVQTDPFVELNWVLENWNLLNVVYDIFVDTLEPPIDLYRAGILDTKLIVGNLSNGETYYWKVIPRVGKFNGSCVSGFWSFTMDIPIPSVTLKSPLNNSILTTLNPTLSWMVEYNGTEKLNYSVFLDTKNQLDLNFERNTTILQMYTRTLQDGETYYWKIVPWVGNIRGMESEVWSFTINLAYIPKFQLALTLDPTVVQLEPGGSVVIKANVTNLGHLTDSIILNLSGSQNIGIWANINESNVRNATPGGIAEFTINVGAIDKAKKGEVEIIIVATSGKAAEYRINYQIEEALKVIVLTEDEPDPDKTSENTTIWIAAVLILIIILVMIILLIIIRKRKPKDQTIKDTTPVKPEGPSTPEQVQELAPQEEESDKPETSDTSTPELAQETLPEPKLETQQPIKDPEGSKEDEDEISE